MFRAAGLLAEAFHQYILRHQGCFSYFGNAFLGIDIRLAVLLRIQRRSSNS